MLLGHKMLFWLGFVFAEDREAGRIRFAGFEPRYLAGSLFLVAGSLRVVVQGGLDMLALLCLLLGASVVLLAVVSDHFEALRKSRGVITRKGRG